MSTSSARDWASHNHKHQMYCFRYELIQATSITLPFHPRALKQRTCRISRQYAYPRDRMNERGEHKILRHPGERADPSPGGRLSTLPARRVGHGTRYAPGTEKGCCVGGTWRHSEIAGGRVALGSRSCFLGVLQQKYF